MTRIVSVSTELPISAELASAKAHQLEMMEFVMRPLLGFRLSEGDRARATESTGDLLPLGEEFAGRLMLFGLIPLWTHRLTIVSDTGLEIFTNESSGPVKTWNHRLTFEPIDESHCRYTDTIEIDRGLIGGATGVFIALFFRHRQRRWHQIAPLLAD